MSVRNVSRALIASPFFLRGGFPSTTDGFVERDQLEHHVALRLCERVLRREDRLLRDKYGEEVREALTVQISGELRRPLIRPYGVPQLRPRRLLVGERDERVLDVLERLQHDALVRGEELLLRRSLERDVGLDPPTLEDRPRDARPEREETALPVEEIGRADALQTGRSRDEEAWEEIARGDADLRRLSGQLPLRSGNVRTAEQ